MRNRLMNLLLVLLFFSGTITAQESMPMSEKFVNTLLCKVGNYTLDELDRKNNIEIEETNNRCNCQDDSNTTTFEQVRSCFNNYSHTIDFLNQFKSFIDSNSYSREQLLDILKDSDNLNSSTFLSNFKNNHKETWSVFLDIFSSSNISVPQLQEHENRKDPVINEEDNKQSSSFVIFKLNILSLLLIIGIAAGFYLLLKPIFHDLDSRFDKLSEKTYINIERKTEETKRLHNSKIDSLESNISRLSERIDELERVNTKNSSRTVEMEVIQPSEPKEPDIFYMNPPDSDGTFNNAHKLLKINPARSVYEFTRQYSNQATFKFIEDDGVVSEAVIYAENKIDRACITDNRLDPRRVKGIKTIERGKAELRGDKWYIVSKARIRYEY